MTNTAAERVAKGAELLDARIPGWHEHIDLGKLELASKSECVLGQLFDKPMTQPAWKYYGYSSAEDYAVGSYWGGRHVGSYWGGRHVDDTVCTANYDLGLDILGLSLDETIAYGFCGAYVPATADFDYPDLDEHWTEEVKKRHNA